MIQRPNVDLPEYNKEGMQTIKKMAREYKDAKTRVMVYPKRRPTLMKQLQVKLEDYDGCGLIEYDEEKEIIYLELTDLLESGIQSHWYYYLNKANTKIVLSNGMLEKIHPRDIITIQVAPRVFGDGYVVPLASVSNDNEVLLPFDIGWENLKKDH